MSTSQQLPTFPIKREERQLPYDPSSMGNTEAKEEHIEEPSPNLKEYSKQVLEEVEQKKGELPKQQAESIEESKPSSEEPTSTEPPSIERVATTSTSKKRKGFDVSGRVGQLVKRAVPYTYEPLSRAEHLGDQVLAAFRVVRKTLSTWKSIPITLNLVWGFLLLFFGKRFIVTFSMIEAFKHGGSETFFKSLNELREQVKRVDDASKKDDELDEDGNGVSDVLELSRREFAKRKIRVVMRAIDPKSLQSAFLGLWTSTVSATAAVKVEFARTITLGISLGDDLYREAMKIVLPPTSAVVDESVRPWLPSIFGYGCRLICIFTAFLLSPILYAVSTSVRGANTLVDNWKEFAKLKNLPDVFAQGENFDTLATWGLVLIGLFFQLFFLNETADVHWLMKSLFFPVFLLEYFLSMFSTFVRSDTERFKQVLEHAKFGGGVTRETAA